MTRRAQGTFVRRYIATFQQEMLDAVKTGKVPAEWGGFELRWFLADITAREQCLPLGGDGDRRRYRAYRRLGPERGLAIASTRRRR